MFYKVDHMGLSVKDLEVSKKFYEEHFGFEKYFEMETKIPGVDKVYFIRSGDIVIELVHMDAVNDGYHLCLLSDNFDADYDRLVAAGIEVQTPAQPAKPRIPEEEGRKRAMFIGPDGEKIEIRG